MRLLGHVDALVTAAQADLDVIALAERLATQADQNAKDAGRCVEMCLKATTRAAAVKWQGRAVLLSLSASHVADVAQDVAPTSAAAHSAWRAHRELGPRMDAARAHVDALPKENT